MAIVSSPDTCVSIILIFIYTPYRLKVLNVNDIPYGPSINQLLRFTGQDLQMNDIC